MVTYEWVSVTLPVKCVWSWIAKASATHRNDFKLYIVQCYGTSECTVSSMDTDTPHLRYFKLRNFKNIKNEIEFETCTEFFLAGMKGHWNEGGRRILLGDNRRRGGHAAAYQVRCVGVWISTGLTFIYVYSWPCVDYTQFRLTQNSTCEGLSGKLPVA